MARNTHILHVPVISQRSDHECGNTVLTSVLQYLGRRCSVDEVYTFSNTTKDGTDHKDMIAGAVKTGATVFARSGGGMKALKEVLEIVSYGLPVICGWWSMGPREKFGDVGVDYNKKWTQEEREEGDCGHYSVLRGYTPSTLLFMDPQDGLRGDNIGYCEYADDEWMRVWYDTDTEAYELVKNWYMVINFEGRRFAGELGAGEDYPPTTKKKS